MNRGVAERVVSTKRGQGRGWDDETGGGITLELRTTCCNYSFRDFPVANNACCGNQGLESGHRTMGWN